VDGTVGAADDDQRSPDRDYLTLLNELKHYNNGQLLLKPALIVKILPNFKSP
jgi:hypothetical protein